jgi:putative addiction module killer protein
VIELVHYEQEDGRCPFDDWLFSLRDKRAQARILTRLRLVESGNMGDCAAVGEGVLE